MSIFLPDSKENSTDSDTGPLPEPVERVIRNKMEEEVSSLQK